MAFPENFNERSEYILSKIETGAFELEWVPLKVNDDLTVFVSSDALKIDGVRINVSATLQQEIADRVGGELLTTEIADLIWVQGDRIAPSTQTITGSVAGMIRHSQEVDSKLSEVANRKGLATNTGKHWVRDNLNLNTVHAINYGWHKRPGPSDGKNLAPSLRKVDGYPLRLIQTRGTFHDRFHWDYSQTCTLVCSVCTYKGVETTPLEDILTMEKTPLTFDGKPLKVLRVVGVPRTYQGPTILPEVRIVV